MISRTNQRYGIQEHTLVNQLVEFMCSFKSFLFMQTSSTDKVSVVMANDTSEIIIVFNGTTANKED